MKKPWRIAGLILLLLLAGGLSWRFFLPNEPVCQGKRASVYLADYSRSIAQWTSSSSSTVAEQMRIANDGKLAKAALQEMGTNLIPVLLRMAVVKESSSRTKLRTYASQHAILQNTLKFLHFWPMPFPSEFHAGAKNGFDLLGSTAAPAVPQLTELLKDPDEDVVANVAMSLSAIGAKSLPALPTLMDVGKNRTDRARANAIFALGTLGPAAAASVDILIEATHSPDSGVRFYAYQSLGSLQAKPDLVIPLLQAVLDRPQTEDTDQTLNDVAVMGLGRFGAAAQSTVPSIRRHLEDKADYTRRDATNALEQIAKAVAAKAQP